MAATHHGVFAHEHYPLNFSFTPQTLANLVHLLRADIVHGNDEDRLVPVL